MDQEKIKIKYMNKKFEFQRIGELGIWQQFSERSNLRRIEQEECDFSEDTLKHILDLIIEESGYSSILFCGSKELYVILERIISSQYLGRGICMISRESDEDMDDDLAQKLHLLLIC